MHPIMTDERHKCENYMRQRESSVSGWHKIEPAAAEQDVWRQKTATVGSNRCDRVGRVGHGRSGYISKNGFQEHT